MLLGSTNLLFLRNTFHPSAHSCLWHLMYQIWFVVLFAIFQHISINRVGTYASDAGVWKTGQWNSCQGSCGPNGTHLRPVFCESKKFHVKIVHKKCDYDKKPNDQKACFKVCDNHRYEFHWKVGTWRKCTYNITNVAKPFNPYNICKTQRSYEGIQHRQVQCVSNSDDAYAVENYVCGRFHNFPTTEQTCQVPCPQDCVTSLFGHWSSCTRSCGNGTQIRTRRIIKMPKYDGAECPPLSEMRSCPNPAPCYQDNLNLKHKLKFGKWSNCSLAQVSVPQSSADVTKRTRSKQARNNHRRLRINEQLIGVKERQVFCLTESGISVGESETLSETCAMSQDCVVSAWSKWSECIALCGQNGTQIRTRKIRQLPIGDNAEHCPILYETQQCSDHDKSKPNLCKSYRWATGAWSSCELIHNVSCGGGLQTRHVYCIEDTHINRQQASLAFSSERSEAANAWAFMQPVEDVNCDQTYKPSDWQECNLPCKHKCDLGQWSDWSECALPSCPKDPSSDTRGSVKSNGSRNSKGFKRRIRPVYNDFGYSEDCKHAVEDIPCDRASCFSWYVASISSCRLESGNCGAGLAEQTLVCKDMWGKVVNNEMCTEVSSTPPQLLPCNVPCSNDCVLGEWGPWSPCTHSCKRSRGKPKLQTRQRIIIANPGPAGRPCPRGEDLSESRLCNQHQCSIYYWSTSKWGPCQQKDVIPLPIGLSSQITNLTSEKAILNFPQNNNSDVCGKGYQTRRVFCQKKGSSKTREKKCISWNKPMPSRECTLPCAKHCVLTTWSQWTSCHDECSKLIAKLSSWLSSFDRSLSVDVTDVYQRRKRYVVQPQVGWGEPCLRELEQSRQCPDDEQCSIYRWGFSQWSRCVLATAMTSIYDESNTCRGVKTRNIFCYRYTSNGRARSYNLTKCLQGTTKIPHATQPCKIPCPRNMAFDEWLQRSRCKATTVDVTTITVREGTQEYGYTSYDNTYYATAQMIARPFGQWSSCFIDERDLQQDAADECSAVQDAFNGEDRTTAIVFAEDPLCGRGRRKRALGCFEEGSNIMRDIPYCSYGAFEEEDCEVPCPFDCEMSDWSRWGECGNLDEGQTTPGVEVPLSLPCGENIQIQFKYFLDEQKNGGRPCPALDSLNQIYKSRPCYSECKSKFWFARGWTKCKPYNLRYEPSCGHGEQARTVECYSTSGYQKFARLVADKRQCDMDSSPLGARNCSLPCSGKCVFTEWSLWGPCMQLDGVMSGRTGTCKSAKRTRTRQIARWLESRDCSPQSLSESEDCRLNVNCFTYRWSWVEWSSCLLSEDSLCGQGYRKRRARCMRSDDVSVHPSKCARNKVTSPTPQFESCKVSCPVDCVVGAWSMWTQCSTTCGASRIRTRTRKVLREASKMGRSCPEDLIQTRPCCAKPCYDWALIGWKLCALSHGNCGEGIQESIVICQQHDGVEVDSTFCEMQQRKRLGDKRGHLYDVFTESQLTRPCRVPCPGECHMSEWSSWSICHADCNHPLTFNMTGTRTRSRAGYADDNISRKDCEMQEVQEEKCSNANCYNYIWKAGPYDGNIREVWCERREDNALVSSGCPEQLKPSTVCPEPCTAKFSYCTTAGTCECRSPFKVVRRPEVSCVMEEDTFITVRPRNNPKDLENIEKYVIHNTSDETTTLLHEPRQPENKTAPDDLSDWELFNPIKRDGGLKVWAYGAIAGLAVLLVFIIALTYLICAACRRGKGKKSSMYKYEKKHRRNNSSGSNVGVGMVVSSGVGSSVYGTGGNGLPPYYVSAPTSHLTPVHQNLSRTPSARSGFSFPDRYDSDRD
ncbi:unnamed protein product [Clavelina lepadiformis]|uniref:Spondin-like TSP1 domain-containing protein n=1 Tax=Clavelina lepadiformis TaxID=159417 RepID=A0ABP0GFD4_CLALP